MLKLSFVINANGGDYRDEVLSVEVLYECGVDGFDLAN